MWHLRAGIDMKARVEEKQGPQDNESYLVEVPVPRPGESETRGDRVEGEG